MPRMSLLKLHRLLTEHGWQWSHHPHKLLLRNRTNKLFLVRLAAPSPDLGCLLIDRYHPILPYKDD